MHKGQRVGIEGCIVSSSACVSVHAELILPSLESLVLPSRGSLHLVLVSVADALVCEVAGLTLGPPRVSRVGVRVRELLDFRE